MREMVFALKDGTFITGVIFIGHMVIGTLLRVDKYTRQLDEAHPISYLIRLFSNIT